jgi:hypothetical protein
MSLVGHNRTTALCGSMSGLPETGHGWAFYEYTPCSARMRTSARLIRDACNAPLHGADSCIGSAEQIMIDKAERLAAA